MTETIHEMRVDSIDYKTRAVVYQCDQCTRRLEIRGQDVKVFAQGDLLDHFAAGIGGLSIVGVGVT